MQPASHPALALVPRPVRIGIAVMIATVVAQALLAAAGVATAADTLGALVVPPIAAGLVAERVRRTHAERAAWIAVVASLGLLMCGNVYCVLAFADPANPPVPSAADIFYLAEYPTMFLALGLLIRNRAIGFRPSLWIDGLVATLSIAGVWTALDPPTVAQCRLDRRGADAARLRGGRRRARRRRGRHVRALLLAAGRRLDRDRRRPRRAVDRRPAHVDEPRR